MTRPITATFVLPSLTGGGAERVVTTLLKYLDSSRVRASLVLINGEDRTLGYGLPDGLQIVDLAR
ncbi:hypothetical protein, partial [Klebsiella pneumoniae]|uniref:hypothetical protein n=1 Tax=Klebsiella pneumoniae TaxID=573 RepID=UPI00210C2358